MQMQASEWLTVQMDGGILLVCSVCHKKSHSLACGGGSPGKASGKPDHLIHLCKPCEGCLWQDGRWKKNCLQARQPATRSKRPGLKTSTPAHQHSHTEKYTFNTCVCVCVCVCVYYINHKQCFNGNSCFYSQKTILESNITGLSRVSV